MQLNYNISESMSPSHSDSLCEVATVNPDPSHVVGVQFLLPAS